MARVYQINISKGGVPKKAVSEAAVTDSGLVGDIQANKEHHGGPDRALCLFSLEVLRGLRDEGHPIEPGFAGENLTISGIEWSSIEPGVRLKVGPEVEIEITSYTSPCTKLKAWFTDGDFTRILHSRHPGESRLYARVLKTGEISVGDEVRLVA